MNYDPNMTLCGRMAKQTVKMTFQQWNYKAELEEVVGGNCTGLTVVNTAIEKAYQSLKANKNIPFIIMSDAEGNTLESDDDEDRGEEWLKDMLVKAEIVAIEATA